MRREGSDAVGRVVEVARTAGRHDARVEWMPDRRQEWVPVADLRCGLRPGMLVRDEPWSRTRRSLGEGVVLMSRRLGGREQVLVDFPERGERVWMPFENLRPVKGVRERFALGRTGAPGNAERFRLRCLAHAIEVWHENTGSLARLDIDPLPHQIHLVHHILASGNLNWLIADDVGLGKTIETGMLLSALVRRGTHRRILLVTPAGLVQQWKDELHHRFGMGDFLIYGEDFTVRDPRHWKMFDRVIGSVDRLKQEPHLRILLQAGNWDIVVFDEAHRLTRSQFGARYHSTDRFRLAAALRRHTDALLLLTATPHQGKHDRFQALLELIRPEWKEAIRTLSANPEILRRMVIRNHKADVTDAEGNFVFQGKTTIAIQVRQSDAERAFDRRLRRYLREGYAAGERAGGTRGRAVGFVMTTYRKLAASSIEAIATALERRRDRLREAQSTGLPEADELEPPDERFAGEWEEAFAGRGGEFFEGEQQVLAELIEAARALVPHDSKLRAFLEELLPQVGAANPEEKVVIFTEYRATQAYLARALRDRFGEQSVSVIHGSQDHEERRAQIAHFEETGRFLVSTEAGGEGINLHRRCHVMVNYDLPWNPMRLVQRVGRLYRYGQKQRVVVLNLHSPDTLDGEILGLLYHRIDQVVRDMATLGGEFRPGLEAEILGEFADALEVERLLEDAARAGVARTRERIEEALERARRAAQMQRELLEYAAGYDPNETRGQFQITPEHLRSFVDGMFEQLGVEVLEHTHSGRVRRVRLPEDLADEIGLRGRQLRVTLDREAAATIPGVDMLDLEHPLLKCLVARAKEGPFDGRVACASGLPGRAVFAAILRWQNDQGVRMRQEFAACLVDESGTARHNPREVSEWFCRYARDGGKAGGPDEADPLYRAAHGAFDLRLSTVGGADLHPESIQFVAGAWVTRPGQL